jgi:hypothetical protein
LPPRNNATGEVTPTFHSGRPSLDGSLDENRFHLAKVVVVERWLLGRLRHSTFRSLAEVSAAIALLLTRLTNRPARRNPSQSAAGDRPNCRQECWRNAERAAVVRNA